MLKFTSVSGSVRAITDITLTGTIIRTGITPDLIIDPITGRTTGTAGIVIAIIIVIPIITGASLTGIATPGWLEAISSQPNFFERNLLRDPAARDQAVYFPDFGETAGLVTGLLPGSSIWNSFLNC
jgi:hypothetical protein